jgi:succinate dehydrogenase / fumarate reductase, iron-sulfur subunit
MVLLMRTSRPMVVLYLALIGTPLILVLLSLSYAYPVGVSHSLLILLAGIGFVVFSVFGFFEVFVHKRTTKNPLPLVVGETQIVSAPQTEGDSERMQINFKVRRFNNQTKSLEENIYRYEADRLTTVLGALIDIKARKDQTLSMRYSCRMGICGSCGMVVNGKPSLACETNVFDVAKKGEVTIEPMQGHPLLKDLVTDFDDFFEKHLSVSPRLYRKDVKEQFAAKQEYKQTQEELDKFLPYSYCIMCGLCVDACPVVNTNPNFVGPQALSQAYRYYKDSRDQADGKRIFEADTIEGIWGCEFAGACSKVCPKGVDPAAAIQLLKSDVMKNLAVEEKKE